MGRPYKDELSAVPETLRWASQVEITPVRRIVEAVASTPLVLIGSGGSLSACELIARLHAEHARQPARVLTPYEFSLLPSDTVSSTWLVSAGGSNRDILAAADKALLESSRTVSALVAKANSRLQARVGKSPLALTAGFDIPFGKDGFLAVNSLISTALIVTRAYEAAFSCNSAQGVSLRELNRDSDAPFEAALRASIVVLSVGWSWPAARDLESKFNETGFGTVVCTDHRNFAHGRHHGLARRSATSGVIALSTPECRRLAERTLRSIPAEIPRLHLTTNLEGARGSIDLISQVFQVVDVVADHNDLDPGRPHVADFGRRLFSMGAPRPRARRPAVDLWIERKVSPVVWTSASEGQRDEWRMAYGRWAADVLDSHYAALALDYDGTVCDTAERTAPPRAAVAEALARLLREGLHLGIATGRGDSVLRALRSTIAPKYHRAVLVGLYNGAFVDTLDRVETLLAENRQRLDASLESAEALLRASPLLPKIASLRCRPTQLTIVATRPLPAGLLYRSVTELLAQERQAVARCRVHQSGHSVDVLPCGVSKLSVVERLQSEVGGAILTIGDQGQLGGNDHLFLARRDSLSVDLASTSFVGCWNLSPAGTRGPAALVNYVDVLRPATAGSGHQLNVQLLQER